MTPQYLLALEKANRHRSLRSDAKRHLKAGRLNVSQLLAKPPAYAQSLAIEVVLRSLPSMGPAKTNRVLRRCRIAPSRPLSALTLPERVVLLADLRNRHPNAVRS